MPDVPEDNVLLTAGGEVEQVAEPDGAGWFEPFIPVVTPGPEPVPIYKPHPLADLLDEILPREGILPTLADTTPETGLLDPAAPADSGDAEAAELSAPVEASQTPPRVATSAELVTWIKLCILARTTLPDDTAELFAFWVISTWFSEALSVFPCLVITGPAHNANRVLHVLKDFCQQAALLAGFRRHDLDVLRCCRTMLVSEPHLDKRTAALLSSLTDSEFRVVGGGYIGRHSKSTAIYAGEDPHTYQIQNAIHIHLAPTNTEPAASLRRLQEMKESVPVHLKQYRDRNLDHVIQCEWAPSGLSSETATIATELGRCIVGAPELRQKLVALLKDRDKQRQTEMANTAEAIVAEATLNLCHEGRPQFLVGEIATEVNRIGKARGERLIYSAETVGHRLKKVGLITRRLGKEGRGLVMDLATVTRAHELAAVYGGVGLDQGENNLHCQLCVQNK